METLSDWVGGREKDLPAILSRKTGSFRLKRDAGNQRGPSATRALDENPRLMYSKPLPPFFFFFSMQSIRCRDNQYSLSLSLSFKTLHIPLFQYSLLSFQAAHAERRKARSIAFLASHPRETGSRPTEGTERKEHEGKRVARLILYVQREIAYRRRVNKRKAVGQRDVATVYVTPKRNVPFPRFLSPIPKIEAHE